MRINPKIILNPVILDNSGAVGSFVNQVAYWLVCYVEFDENTLMDQLRVFIDKHIIFVEI